MGTNFMGGGGSREIEHYYKNIPRCACLRKTQQGKISVTPAAKEIKNSKVNLIENSEDEDESSSLDNEFCTKGIDYLIKFLITDFFSNLSLNSSGYFSSRKH